MPGQISEVVELKDGRALGLAHFGDRSGVPVFFFHGFPGSRLEAGLIDEPATAAAVHVIALDRPGFGLSDYAPRRTIGSWADDVAGVAAALGIERFGVVGVSGGGPYALACARRLSDRLTGAAFVSGAPPPEAPGTASAFRRNAGIFKIGRVAPFVPRMLFDYMSWKLRRNPNDLRDYLLPIVPPADRVQLERDDVADLLRRDQLEAFRHGTRGPARESLLLVSPWDFHLENIRMPVHVWQGEADIQVSPEGARWLVSRLPHGVPHFIPGGGHYSVILEDAPAILAAVVGRAVA
jgi:pimeloyl-ACP methyl ester carboxylesterase